MATLRAGDRMLLDQGALAALRPGEGRDAARQARPGAAIAPIQLWTLAQIARRFTLKPIHRDQAGFVVVELTPRR